MGYIYNAKGRMLRENLTYSIGVISSEKYYGKDDYFYIDLYKHLSNQFRKLGFTTTFNIINSQTKMNCLSQRAFWNRR
ncbi:hypothetical protein [Anaerocellum danielii]|uniref:hypothetical protein n=1 Tax=Anaerocellum danielii TaxID=1387557 RepID=UPI000AF072FE|nr:hypothetical protein [Caldicellulosiruptor danielii]